MYGSARSSRSSSAGLWQKERITRMSTPQETRVALVGAGYVSAYHIRALQTLPHVRIVGIADTRGRTGARAGANASPSPVCSPACPRCATCTPGRRPRPDAAGLARRLAIEALAMGCDVFVEKPMAPTVAECDEMIAAANRAGRIAVGEPLRQGRSGDRARARAPPPRSVRRRARRRFPPQLRLSAVRRRRTSSGLPAWRISVLKISAFTRSI